MYLSLKNISKKYKDKEILKNITFDIKEGELVCILGPSGCGKTTLLNIIGGFVSDYSGDVLLSNENINNIPPEKREIATVFQSYGLFTHKNVIDNVSYGLKLLKIDKNTREKKARDMLEKVGLAGYEKKKIKELSGGEQQRVAIARSMVLNPKLLLLDEPLSNLDVHLRDVMRKEIKRIQKQFGVTMIIVTHDQEDAFKLADRVVVINEGHIEQIGTPEELYKQPKSNFISSFIGENNIIGENLVIRPEEISIKLDNSGDGEVVDVTYLGATVEYLVENSDGNTLKVLMMSTAERFNIGDKVSIRINN
ncbi:ABC transporter ATP-binding protein [Gemella sp. 27098_8_149]|jgi:ABC superfamily ATP binding cassette transporter, ABC protein|uniref:ABC transporter ATP-binding protein n=1 Tax=Gemella sp. 27098_8_149 TaxID=3003689 RepID=UPI00352FDF24